MTIKYKSNSSNNLSFDQFTASDHVSASDQVSKIYKKNNKKKKKTKNIHGVFY